ITSQEDICYFGDHAIEMACSNVATADGETRDRRGGARRLRRSMGRIGPYAGPNRSTRQQESAILHAVGGAGCGLFPTGRLGADSSCRRNATQRGTAVVSGTSRCGASASANVFGHDGGGQ